MAKFIKITRHHRLPSEPVFIYCEFLGGTETRRVEQYHDGRTGYADSGRRAGATRLGNASLASLKESVKAEGHRSDHISAGDFEKIWRVVAGVAPQLANVACSGGSLANLAQSTLRIAVEVGAPGQARKVAPISRAVRLAQELTDAGLGELEAIVDYRLPLTNKRVDLVLAGADPTTGKDIFVLVEWKQWVEVRSYGEDPELINVPFVSTPTLHPIRQVESYCRYMADFLDLPAGGQSLFGIAYLFNARDKDVQWLSLRSQQSNTRLFTSSSRRDLVDFLRNHVIPSVGAADRLQKTRVRPSRPLLSSAAHEVRDQDQFVLLGQQRVAFELVLRSIVRASLTSSKEVVVVRGGPGAGKSALALSLLGELARQGRSVLYATGSKALTESLRKHVGRGSSQMKGLFTYFNSITDTSATPLDVLICDEAQRIRSSSTNRFTPRGSISGKAQIDELLDAARVTVFLLDEDQKVRDGEIGSLNYISLHTKARGIPQTLVDLDEHFGRGGIEPYFRWVSALVDDEVGHIGNHSAGGVSPADDLFPFLVADSPADMANYLAERSDEGYSARIMAGLCWPFGDSHGRALASLVKVGDWSMPWHVRGDRSVGGAPAGVFWATDSAGFGQVGSVYVAQGFVFDWAGVIIGPDLVVREGRWVTIPEANLSLSRTDRNASSGVSDKLIRNSYRVLLTRATAGMIVYSTDPETRRFLNEKIVGRVPHPG